MPVNISHKTLDQIEKFYNNRNNFLQVHYAIEKYSWVNKRIQN
jgi:hypothetical protein